MSENFHIRHFKAIQGNYKVPLRLNSPIAGQKKERKKKVNKIIIKKSMCKNCAVLSANNIILLLIIKMLTISQETWYFKLPILHIL